MPPSEQTTSAAKLRVAITRLYILPRALSLIWTTTPVWTITWAGLLLIQGLLPVGIVALTRPLIDGLVQLTDGGGAETVGSVIMLAGLVVLLMLANELIESASDWVRAIQAELVRDQISDLVHSRSVTVDLSFYESPDYYDQLHRARDDAGQRPLELLENLGELLRGSVTLTGIALVLSGYALWLPLLLLLSMLPALVTVLFHSRRYHHWWQRTTTDRRWGDYYDTMLTDGEAAAEVRLFGLGGPFRAAYAGLRRHLRTEQLRLVRDQHLARLVASITALVIAGPAIFWMLNRVVHGLSSVGDLVLFYQVFTQGQALARVLLGNLGSIYLSTLFLDNLFSFLDLRPQITDPAKPLIPAAPREMLRFRQVAFRYPGSEQLTLQDFDLTIPAGKVTAIVGANGAGKSTLIKLLCRFYDPEAGSVELDGVDLRRFKVDELRRLITVIFQHPVAYQATAAQNIALGDPAGQPDDALIEAAAHGAGAHEVIERLPQGYATRLGKWFADGTDLSGGEWQRLALARAFLRRSPIVMLDEPTSFMDSWAEAEWLDRFRTLVAGRTALIITHRFTTAMRADIIHVMDRGVIVESGNHAELVALGGLYARSWQAQIRDQTYTGGGSTTETAAFLDRSEALYG